MTEQNARMPLPDLPAPYVARVPVIDDVNKICALVLSSRRSVRGDEASVNPQTLAAQIAGPASWTRRQVVVESDGTLVAWAYAHDRAAGRTNVEMILDPDLPGTELGSALASWLLSAALDLAASRGLAGTALDTVVEADDERAHTLLHEAEFAKERTWQNMSRPVVAADAEQPEPPAGVRVRQINRQPNGTPVAEDLQAVHAMLEDSFADHFNSYRESLAEFITRMREDPGHRWDHWWLAEIADGEHWVPGGAVVCTVLAPDRDGIEGSYIDYLGVARVGRGKGLSKAMLRAVIADAARRGRNRVGLEVDADSPTGANGIYESLGWVDEHVTETWQRTVGDVEVEAKPLEASA